MLISCESRLMLAPVFVMIHLRLADRETDIMTIAKLCNALCNVRLKTEDLTRNQSQAMLHNDYWPNVRLRMWLIATGL